MPSNNSSVNYLTLQMSSSGDEAQYEFNSADESDESDILEDYEDMDIDSDDEDADMNYDMLEESINIDASDSEADNEDPTSGGEESPEKCAHSNRTGTNKIK